MGLRNGWRKRKHDQGDRGSQHAQDSLLQHHRSIVAQLRPRYRPGTRNSRRECCDCVMVTVRYCNKCLRLVLNLVCQTGRRRLAGRFRRSHALQPRHP
jgi:hypothetical protein